MSKAEAIDALSSRYDALYTERQQVVASDLLGANNTTVVMPKPPPRAPPGISPPAVRVPGPTTYQVPVPATRPHTGGSDSS
eukprot:scaffold172820_cov14-Prasinocladus_malaysianus.AAC.1